MSKETQAISNDLDQLADDARALMAATADVAGEKVEAARRRLTVALERGGAIYGRVRETALKSSRAADETVRDHPYRAIALGLGVGALFGYLASRRCCQNNE